MHRVVTGYKGEMDVDHINRNSLDNRRENLRIVSRSENLKNMKTHTLSGECRYCGAEFHADVTVNVRSVTYCSDLCKRRAQPKQVYAPQPKTEKMCLWCGDKYHTHSVRQAKFCSESCRKKAKWARQKREGRLPPSASGSCDTTFPRG